MSEWTEGPNQDDHAILLALARVIASGTDVPLPASASSPEVEARVLQYVEVLGLLPYELEPVAPAIEVKGNVLAEIGAPIAIPRSAGDSAAGAPRGFDEMTFAGSAAGAGSVDVTLARPSAGAGAETAVDDLTLAGMAAGASASDAPAPAAETPPQPFEIGAREIGRWEAEVPAAESAPDPGAWSPSPPPVDSAGFTPAAPPEPVAPTADLPAAPDPPPVVLDPEAPAPGFAQSPAVAAPESVPETTAPAEALALSPPPASPTASAPPPSRSGWWPTALAAMLALSVLGAGYLAGKVNQQNATIARLNSQLQALPVEDVNSLTAELDDIRRRFHMVTSVARKAYRMEPTAPSGRRPAPQGVVYVCGNHQRWYLNVQSLDPAPAGQEYRLWFVTDQGLSGGRPVAIGPDGVMELEDQSMPEGTHGFAVTLERAGASDETPHGAMVLLAEDSVNL